MWTTVIVVGGDGHSVGFWLFPRSPAINRTAIKMVTMTPAAKPTISARMIAVIGETSLSLIDSLLVVSNLVSALTDCVTTARFSVFCFSRVGVVRQRFGQ